MAMWDPKSLSAFHSAATHLNFTRAARDCAMTQSGMSQHIARLEEALGAELFERVNRKVILTRAGELLLKYVEKEKEEGRALKDAIEGEVHKAAGLVRYAMPHSCLLTPHLTKLMDKRVEFDQISFEITLCRNDEILEMLLKQEIDFGFVTRTAANPAFHFEKFCEEEYVLVGKDPAAFKDPLHQGFVSYPGMYVLYEMWTEHFLPARKRLCPTALKITGRINSLHGAITMVEKGLGLTVVPRHCVEELIQAKKLHVLHPPKTKRLTNPIQIVRLADSRLPFRVQTVLNSFWEMKTTYH